MTVVIERDGMKATFNPANQLVLVHHRNGSCNEWFKSETGALLMVRGGSSVAATEAECSLVQAVIEEVARRRAALTPGVHAPRPIDQPLDPSTPSGYARMGTGNRRRSTGRRVTDLPNTAEVLAGFRDAVEAAGITTEQMTNLIIELGARGLTVTSDQQAAQGAPSTLDRHPR